jgi:asparagine synthase (glutamine-hydrolysing)
VFAAEPSAPGGARAPLTLGLEDTKRIVRTQGRYLLGGFWGRYVAFGYDDSSATTWVLRDPMGGLPCFMTELHGLRMFFSRVEDCTELTHRGFAYNWTYLRSRAAQGLAIQSQDTGLAGVSDVQPGEGVYLQRNRIEHGEPWAAVCSERAASERDPARAATQLYETVSACVHAWSSCYPSILHRLSGGLDSAIVLACLRAAPTQPAVTCVNYYSAGLDCDEREFARVAAAATPSKLIESERNLSIRFEGMLNIQPAPNPSYYLGYVGERRLEAQLAADSGACATFDGLGGDQLFYHGQMTLAALDYILTGRCDKHCLQFIVRAARRDNVSVWHLLKQAIVQATTRRHRDPFAEGYQFRSLLAPELLNAVAVVQRDRHAQANRAERLPPGKYVQIVGWSFPQQFYDPLAKFDDPEPVQPLISQPLVELCTRIPTYVLAVGARDRGLVRRAFARQLPGAITERFSKGGMEHYIRQVSARNWDFVKDVVLNGRLIREGILDRRKVEEFLSGRPASSGVLHEVLDYLGIEVWIKSFERSGTQYDTRHALGQ